MSNESQTPSLRLRPRPRLDPAAATPEKTAAPTPEESPAASASGPLSAPAPLPASIPAPLPPERVPAPLPANPAPPPAEDPGKFKLRPRIKAPAAQTTASAGPAAPAEAGPSVSSGPIQIPKPALPAAALASPAFARPTAPVSGRPNMPIAPLPSTGPASAFPSTPRKPVAPVREQSSRAGRNGLKLLLALLFVATGLFAVLAYNYWFADPAAPAPVARKSEPVESAVPPPPVSTESPSAVVAEPGPAPEEPAAPASDAGKLLAHVKETVAAHDAAHVAPVEAALAPETPAAPVASTVSTTPAAPAAENPPASVAEETVAGQSAPPAATPVINRPEPSAAFRSFVVNMKINGVFQGENARAMINGKMYRLGETVDAKLGIVFRRLNPEDKRITFEDARGATMSRRY